MAKVYQLEVVAYNQPTFDEFAHSLLFADSITPVAVNVPEGAAGNSIVVTSGVDSSAPNADYKLLANDSRSEAAREVSTGKFVEGNMIAVLCCPRHPKPPSGKPTLKRAEFVRCADEHSFNSGHPTELIGRCCERHDCSPDEH